MPQSIKGSLKRKALLIALLQISWLCLPPDEALAEAVIEVGPGHGFARIGDAIREARAGDLIMVYEGFYEENLVIPKSLRLVGQGNVLIRGADPSEPTVLISTNNTVLENLNLTVAKRFFSTVVFLSRGSSLNRIVNNSIGSAYFGIFSEGTFGNVIAGNAVSGSDFGIILNESSQNLIEQNRIEHNKYGLVLSSGFANTITRNKFADNTYGAYLFGSRNTLFADNLMVNDSYAIYLTAFSTDNEIMNNTSVASQYGIFLDTANSNVARGNSVKGSLYGFYLRSCRENLIASNLVANCTVGINTDDAWLNVIWRNFVTANSIGISLDRGYNQTISENFLLENEAHAVYLYRSTATMIRQNKISGSENGIVLAESNNNAAMDDEVRDTFIGVYMYQSQNNTLTNEALLNGTQWLIKNKSDASNYARGFALGSGRLNFSLKGIAAIRAADPNVSKPAGYTFLELAVYINTTQGAYVLANFSHRDLMADGSLEDAVVLYTDSGKTWERAIVIEDNERAKTICVLVEASGTYALFSGPENRGPHALIFPSSVVVLVLAVLLVVMRKRRARTQ